MGEYRDRGIDFSRELLKFLNIHSSDIALSESSALEFCYNSNRVSNSLHMRAISEQADFEKQLSEFCTLNNYTYTKRDDNSRANVRYVINLDEHCTWKISCRGYSSKYQILDCDVINGMLVLDIKHVLSELVVAYRMSSKAKLLYDLVFVYRHYGYKLSEDELREIRTALGATGISIFNIFV